MDHLTKRIKNITLHNKFKKALEENGIEFTETVSNTFIIKGEFDQAEIFINEDSEYEYEFCSVDKEFTKDPETFNFEVDMQEMINIIHDQIIEGGY